MAELRGVAYLRNKLNSKRNRVNLRYKYYEMKNIVRDFNISTPPQLSWFTSCLGWCGTAVDALADRLQVRGFKNDDFGLTEIFTQNNFDIMLDSAILGALISSCDFIYIVPDNNGYPKMQVIDGGNATGTIDETTGLLFEGYAVLERDAETNQPTLEAYFEPYKTTYIYANEWQRVFEHNVAYPLLVPIIYKPDARRPFGHSRITRSCMKLVDSAVRTLKRSEISAEFYSIPQKWITGLSQEAEPMEKWKATMSTMITFTKDKDGDSPTLGQFAQQSMTPHFEQVKLFASAFAGQTGLTLDDLGFPTENPSSAEAIKATHETLRLTAKKAQRQFASGIINAGMLASCLRDNFDYNRTAFSNTKVLWQPVFEPDYAGLSQIGDGAIKINQAIDGYFDVESLHDLTGIDPANR